MAKKAGEVDYAISSAFSFWVGLGKTAVCPVLAFVGEELVKTAVFIIPS